MFTAMFKSVPCLRHRKLISPLRHVAWTLRVSNAVRGLSDGAEYSKESGTGVTIGDSFANNSKFAKKNVKQENF